MTVEQLLVARESARFTPTERRIVTLLADGFGHSWRELMGLLDDDLANRAVLRCHLHNLRKKLPSHILVLVEFNRRTLHYRMARRIGGGDEA